MPAPDFTLGRRAARLAIAALALAGCATTADQTPPTSQMTGQRLAQRACSGCHGMTPVRPGLDHAAPPFWTLAGRHTPESLMRATGTAPAHQKLAMPVITLSRTDAVAILAYMDALAAAPPRSWKALDVTPCISTGFC